MRLDNAPLTEIRLGGLRSLGRPVANAWRSARKDTRRFFALRKEIRQLGHKKAMAKSMTGYVDDIGTAAQRTKNSKYLETLSAKLKDARSEYGDVIGRQAVRVGSASVGLAGVGYGARAYRLRKAQVNQRPQFRQMDVYPQHNFAAAGATKFRRPYYDTAQGGREEPRRSGSPTIYGEETVSLFEEKKRRKSAVTYQQMLKMHPSDFTPAQMARMERKVKSDPLALRHYKFLRKLYKLGEGAKSALWTAFLMQLIGFKNPATAAGSGFMAAKAMYSADRGARSPMGHRKALRRSVASKMKRKELAKSNRLMREGVALTDLERQKIIERILNTPSE